MIDEILAYTSTYLTSQQKENRKQKGQFFTTENIAKFIAAKSSCKADHLFILDNFRRSTSFRQVEYQNF